MERRIGHQVARSEKMEGHSGGGVVFRDPGIYAPELQPGSDIYEE